MAPWNKYEPTAARKHGKPGRAARPKSITIDKGSDDGVNLNATVVASGGALVGQVQEVGRNYATVRLLNDTRSVVNGRDVRTGVTGAVKGNLSAPLDMVDVPATKEIATGDTVVTAGGFGPGFGSQFPKDIVIGRIIEVHKDPASIVIKPFNADEVLGKITPRTRLIIIKDRKSVV